MKQISNHFKRRRRDFRLSVESDGSYHCIDGLSHIYTLGVVGKWELIENKYENE